MADTKTIKQGILQTVVKATKVVVLAIRGEG